MAQAVERVQEGRLFTVRIGGYPHKICLVRQGPTWHAFDDVCPHKMASFSQSKGTITAAGGVVCPLHGYVFRLTTGFEITNQQCPALHILPLRIDAEGLAIGLPTT